MVTKSTEKGIVIIPANRIAFILSENMSIELSKYHKKLIDNNDAIEEYKIVPTSEGDILYVKSINGDVIKIYD